MIQLPFLFSVAISGVDSLIVAVYITATTLLGIYLGRGQVNNRDFFLGGHRLPTWALLVSIVATETSTATFLSVPGKAYVDGGSFRFLQLTFGYILGRFAVILFLLPGYFRGEMLSAYQVLEQRFGVATRRLSSLVFLVTRNMADGLRLFLTALALKLALDLDIVTCILVTTIATSIYAVAGGVRSVVWNDCVQFAVYMLGAVVAACMLIRQIPGGWNDVVDFGQTTGRWRLLDFDFSLSKSTITFWVGCVGGGFLSLASHGVDQLIVQRYLCAKSRTAAAWALGLSGFVVLAQFALFLLIGVLLACFNQTTGGIGDNVTGDEAFMTYVVRHMGIGVTGLILAAVLSAAMSTTASSLNSSASSIVGDWIVPLMPNLDARTSLRLSRLLTLVFAVVQGLVALGADWLAMERAIIDSVLAIAGFAIGLLLGLYGLGIIAPRTPQRVALAAFAAGTAVTTYVAFRTPLNSYWYTLVGCGTIVIVGLVLGMFVDRRATSTA